MHKPNYGFWSVLSGAMLSACAVGPDYERPAVTIPSHFKEASNDWKRAQPKQVEQTRWWESFQDPNLNFLETQLLLSNQSIATAEANYREARALVDKARASFFPTLSGLVNVTRSKASSSSGSTSATSGSAGKTITSQSLALDASWEPDIWGAVRRAVEASEANAEASAALLAGTRLSAEATLAQNYFQLQTLDSTQRLLDDTLKNNRKLLKITQAQYKSGVASQADVKLAESTLQTSEADALDNQIARAQFEHAIAVLIGMAPAEFSLKTEGRLIPPPKIAPMLPASLLERRPDVAQAEQVMVSANAEIGVAKAAYFPALTFTASGGYAGQNLSHWISEPALNWALGASLAETIFDGGLRSATVDAAWATYEAEVASYRQTILSAFQDVEDNLVSLRILAAEYEKRQAAADSSKVAYELTIKQYQAGTVPLATVLTTANTLNTAQLSAVSVAGLRMSSAVGLIKALGGGWAGLELPECETHFYQIETAGQEWG